MSGRQGQQRVCQLRVARTRSGRTRSWRPPGSRGALQDHAGDEGPVAGGPIQVAAAELRLLHVVGGERHGPCAEPGCPATTPLSSTATGRRRLAAHRSRAVGERVGCPGRVAWIRPGVGCADHHVIGIDLQGGTILEVDRAQDADHLGHRLPLVRVEEDPDQPVSPMGCGPGARRMPRSRNSRRRRSRSSWVTSNSRALYR